jgi:hypothetical protein
MNGQRIDGTWEATDDTPPVFKDDSGRIILLNPGRTWIGVMPTGESIVSEYEGVSSEEVAEEGADTEDAE